MTERRRRRQWRLNRHRQEITAMKGFADDIEKLTLENDDFRRVLYTGKNIQLVLMTIQPGEDIGEEVHEDRDQFFRFEAGGGEVVIDGVANRVKADHGVIVPAGARHNVVNTGSEPLRLYTIYGPPEHLEGTVEKTRADADASHEHFDGRTTE
jgi:mannose-6-phosphate isomerase-like protein (cupin superfamily)